MPIAKVQLEDGRIGRFEVPEGTTPEQVEAFARNSMAVGGGVNEGVPQEPQAQQPPTAPMPSLGRTVLDQGLQGATFGGADEVTDRIGAGIAAMSQPDLTYKDALSQAREMTGIDQKNQLEQRPVASILSQLGGGLFTGGAGASTKAGSALANYVRSGNLMSRIAKGATAGAASGGLYGAGSAEDGERLQGLEQGAATGATIGGAIPGVGATLSGLKQAAVPTIEAGTKALAERARAFGIPLRMDQVSPSRARNTLQKVSQEIPFSGVDEAEKVQRQAFTKAVAKTIGQDAEDLGPDTVNSFLGSTNSKFKSAIGNGDFKVTTDDFSELSKIEDNLPKNVTEDIANIVRKNTEKFRNDLTKVSTSKTVPDGIDGFGYPLKKRVTTQENPIISADKLSSLRSDLIKSLPKIDSKAWPHVSEIIDVIDGIAERNISPEQASNLKQVRREWRNFKTIEPLLEKSTDGQVNPTELLNRVKASPYIKASRAAVGEDDLVDLARIGKQFLPKKGGSDTFQKSALGTGLLGAGYGLAANPLLTIGATVGVPLANKGLQKFNTSQALIDYALRTSGTPPKLEKYLRKAKSPLLGGTSSNAYQSLDK